MDKKLIERIALAEYSGDDRAGPSFAVETLAAIAAQKGGAA